MYYKNTELPLPTGSDYTAQKPRGVKLMCLCFWALRLLLVTDTHTDWCYFHVCVVEKPEERAVWLLCSVSVDTRHAYFNWLLEWVLSDTARGNTEVILALGLTINGILQWYFLLRLVGPFWLSTYNPVCLSVILSHPFNCCSSDISYIFYEDL